VRPIVHASSLLLAIALLATGVASAQPQTQAQHKDDLARARVLDREGAKAYSEGRYNDAIRYFEEAYRLGGPAFELWNVAKCQVRLDQPEQAASSLERYLSLPNLPKEDREEAAQQLDSLKKRPSTLTISSTPSGAQVSVDGKTVEGRTPVSITVAPGPHTVTVSSASSAPYTSRVEARYGRAVIVDASLADGDARPPTAPNAYAGPDDGRLALRTGINVVLPRYGSIGGNPGVGLLVLGTYKLLELDRASIAAGGLLSVVGDAWRNRTGQPNEAAGCASLRDAQSATALSAFAVGAASVPLASGVRFVGTGGVGLAGYFVDNVGGDLFVPSCRPSPGVRPALLLGAQVDYAVTKIVRLSVFPLTWQVQPSFDGTRAAPRDASGIWMRFGFGLGAGVDL
jgi:opacity protein-like surface antigen